MREMPGREESTDPEAENMTADTKHETFIFTV